jgi:hypothetical protein
MKNKLIKEALGVRPELFKLAQIVYTEVLSYLRANKDILIGKNPEHSINVKIGNFPLMLAFKDKAEFILDYIKEIEVELRFIYTKDESPEIKTAAFSIPYVSVRDYYISKHKAKPVIEFRVTGKKNIKFSQIADFLVEKEPKIITLLAHELKHMYDALIGHKRYPANDVSYAASVKPVFNKDIIEYGKKIAEAAYYTSIVELHIRATEIYAYLMSRSITKKEFLNELSELSIILRYKGYIKTFDYDLFIAQIFQDLAKSNNNRSLYHMTEKVFNVKNPSIDTVKYVGVEYILYLIRKDYFKNVSNISKNIFPFYNFISFWKKFGFFKKEQNVNPKDIINKLSVGNYYNEPKFTKESIKRNSFFFKKMFKTIRYRSHNILRKLYKVYSLLPDR